jgi:hypothetical protein
MDLFPISCTIDDLSNDPFIITTREVYFALSSWYGEALPGVCRRTSELVHRYSETIPTVYLPLYPLSSREGANARIRIQFRSTVALELFDTFNRVSAFVVVPTAGAGRSQVYSHTSGLVRIVQRVNRSTVALELFDTFNRVSAFVVVPTAGAGRSQVYAHTSGLVRIVQRVNRPDVDVHAHERKLVDGVSLVTYHSSQISDSKKYVLFTVRLDGKGQSLCRLGRHGSFPPSHHMNLSAGRLDQIVRRALVHHQVRSTLFVVSIARISLTWA